MEELSGKVFKSEFASGSKSEHEAVFLNTDKGRFTLRRMGGNAFYDADLENLVGKTIQARGEVTGSTFLMCDWEELDRK